MADLPGASSHSHSHHHHQQLYGDVVSENGVKGHNKRTASPDSSTQAGDSVSGSPMRKKQKRNKPTLSCAECVERKTKVTNLTPIHLFRTFSQDCSVTEQGLHAWLA